MPLQNRVTPTGEIIADPGRGTLMGNRGILHDDHRTLGRARWKHRAWISCALQFKGRRRRVMAPRRYTELFFLDEAVALAAGHRPCGECRRDRYREFMRLWDAACGDLCAAKPQDVDRVLHAARIDGVSRRALRRYADRLAHMPDGAFILLADSPETPLLVWGQALHPYAAGGYGMPRKRPTDADAVVLTPAPIVQVLRAGYVPGIHPSATRSGEPKL